MSSASKSKSLKLSSGESLRKSFSKGFKKFNSMLTPRTEKAHQEKVNPEKQQPQAGAKDVEKPKEEAKPAEQEKVVVEEPTPMFEGVVTEEEEAAKSPVAPQSPEVQEEIVKSPDAAAETDSSHLASTVIETAPVDEGPEAAAEPLVATPVEGPAEVEEAVVKKGLGPLGMLSIAGAVAVGVVLGVKGPLRRRQSA